MPIKKLLERNAFIIAISITIFIALVSLVSLKGIHVIKTNNSDKFGHFLAYFILCLSWLNVSKNSQSIKVNNYIIIVLLISYGIILEVLQEILTTYRQADLFDMIANSLGVLCASLFFNKLNKIF